MIVASTARLRDSALGRDEVVAADDLLFMNRVIQTCRTERAPAASIANSKKGRKTFNHGQFATPGFSTSSRCRIVLAA